MTEKFSRYDSADYLKTDEDIALYFETCLEENDPALIAHALGVIARAKDMMVINTLGLRLNATAAPAA